QALLVPAKLDLRGVRAGAVADGGVPHLLRGLIRAGRQLARAATARDGELVRRLTGLAKAEQRAMLLDLVRARAATVLGHAGPEGVRADLAFKDVGFDSLTSVELRNRLRDSTGLKLPATLVFDYPTPEAIARYLHHELLPDGDAVGLEVHEERLRNALVSVPLIRFREAGLLDALIKLVAPGDGALDIGAIDKADEDRAISELDVDDLVQLALGD
ncbi:acyl carrier protein, partial [Streptomyces sp. 2A115]|uniref:acyl carrier protein n=1 Tax=Streptomyces sp. 2A115 TaxID=3457439 RepID=UPI003FD54E8F